MVTQQERARLVEAYKDEPVYVAAVILKCATCLLMIAGLGLIGAGVERGGDNASWRQAHRPDRPAMTQGTARYRQARRVEVQPTVGKSSLLPGPAVEVRGTQPVAGD